MLLVFAWLLLAINSFALLGKAGLAPSVWGISQIALFWLFLAWVTWLLLLIRYHQTIVWMKRISKALDISSHQPSYQKMRLKWRRVHLQLWMIVFLLLAYFVFEATSFFHDQVTQPWVLLGIWVVWVHSLVWFTLSWSRDIRLKHNLEREVEGELDRKVV